MSNMVKAQIAEAGIASLHTQSKWLKESEASASQLAMIGSW